ncbi:MAG: hypothetical protein A2937_02545 [Candidatus Yonathbacteria bacterium RIFCSPLOWO2_01_FULL_47_33b]|uniref:Uncharacterized protein n=1 Tax=Candidatus Yonathbacteria bacterium RIFCSPLOWO2_01_FULL_47_33b TaxID=1802727 RepID=A0A1G2SHC5_9BACT|nr:MAG: hypothetical protein A2937_02545 [Candidatus Yonathbacteria bacterium RIFCSPLOWO2_01_FULL_47_33b]
MKRRTIMFKVFFSLFRGKPKQEELCRCGCGVLEKFLPYDKGGAHETNLVAQTVQNPVSPKAQDFYDRFSAENNGTGDHVSRSRGGCGGGSSG